MEKNKPAALGKGNKAGCSELLQLNYITKPEHCPKFKKCNAPICPIDPNWRSHTHLRDDPVCFYLREYSKGGLRLKFEGGLTTQIYHRLTLAYHGIVSSFYDIKKQLEHSAKKGSRLGRLPGATKKVRGVTRKKIIIPFDKRGGVCVLSRRMLNHRNYLTLSAQAKVLILLMHEQWRDEKEVDFGIREAAGKIPCSRPTAMKAFKQLEKREFIHKISESFFSSRTESKTRTWRLTWMPWLSRKPTSDWEKWGGKN